MSLEGQARPQVSVNADYVAHAMDWTARYLPGGANPRHGLAAPPHGPAPRTGRAASEGHLRGVPGHLGFVSNAQRRQDGQDGSSACSGDLGNPGASRWVAPGRRYRFLWRTARTAQAGGICPSMPVCRHRTHLHPHPRTRVQRCCRVYQWSVECWLLESLPPPLSE